MTRTLLLSAAALALVACGGEVTDGGTGSDTDFEEIADEEHVYDEAEATELARGDVATQPAQANVQPGQERTVRDPDDPRAGDYPEAGEEQTRNPIEPGNEEPGGKDMMLQEEYAALDQDAPSAQRAPLEAARREATGPVAEYQDRLYLSRRGVSLDHLGEEPVMTADGEDRFEIEDVLLSPAADSVLAFVLEGEGTLGIPGDQYLAPADRAGLVRDGEDGNLRLALKGDKDELAEFDEDALPPGAMLASGLIRQPVRVGEDAETAAVDDLVMDEDGTLYGIALAYVGERYLIRPDQLVLAQGDGGYELAITADELREMPFYVGIPAYEGR